MDNEIKVINDIKIAILMLKEKKVLLSVNNKNKTYFILKNDKIYVFNDNSSYTLPLEMFTELYSKNEFIEYIYNEQTFDFSRDDEYYNWKHK
ncbi:MAG: hypothetical protein SOU19_06315 [Candidatus Caccosoma sp.]|nr:hypothetical protein [Candidatus Caccosoma sp.]